MQQPRTVLHIGMNRQRETCMRVSGWPPSQAMVTGPLGAPHLARGVPTEHLAHPLVHLHHLWVQLRGQQLLPIPTGKQAGRQAGTQAGSHGGAAGSCAAKRVQEGAQLPRQRSKARSMMAGWWAREARRGQRGVCAGRAQAAARLVRLAAAQQWRTHARWALLSQSATSAGGPLPEGGPYRTQGLLAPLASRRQAAKQQTEVQATTRQNKQHPLTRARARTHTPPSRMCSQAIPAPRQGAPHPATPRTTRPPPRRPAQRPTWAPRPPPAPSASPECAPEPGQPACAAGSPRRRGP